MACKICSKKMSDTYVHMKNHMYVDNKELVGNGLKKNPTHWNILHMKCIPKMCTESLLFDGSILKVTMYNLVLAQRQEVMGNYIGKKFGRHC